MAKDFPKIAKDVLGKVGGVDNVSNLAHCATRLRFWLKDYKVVNDAEVKATGGVQGVVKAGGMYQIIIGPGDVDMVYDELGKLGCKLAGSVDADADGAAGEKPTDFKSFVKYWGGKMLSTMSGIMSPIIPVLFAAGILGALYAILNQALSDGAKASDTMRVLEMIKDLALYSMPVTVGYSAAKRFKVDPILGIVLGLALIAPQMTAWAPNMFNPMGPNYTDGVPFTSGLTFLGIPMLIMSYQNALLPPIFIVWAASFLYKWLQKKLPGVIKLFFAPAITMLVMIPISLLVIGPIFGYVGYGLGEGINAMLGVPFVGSVLLGILFGALWQTLVIFGIHVAVIPAIYAEIATNYGKTGNQISMLAVVLGVAVLSQFGAVVAMMLKIKNKERKAAAASAAFSGAFGITEPIIYGFTLNKRKPFVYATIGAALGGGTVGLLGVKSGLAGQGFLMLTGNIWDGFGSLQLWGALLALAISIGVAFALTFLLYKPDAAELRVEEVAKIDVSRVNVATAKKILAPCKGRVLPLTQSADPAHQEETLGKGVAIMPLGKAIVAPFDGTVSMVFDTKHAIGLKSKDGVELLIHVGIDTVKLNGKGFTPLVKEGQKITAGEPILNFDGNAIARAGYSLETQVVVTNTPEFKAVTQAKAGETKPGEVVVYVE